VGLPFTLGLVNPDYTKWPLVPDLFPVSFPGVKTSRDDVLVDIDRERLVERMAQYFDPQISHEEMGRIAPMVMQDTARFKAEAVRDTLRKRGFLEQNIVRYCYRPFDVRWLYWEPETKLLDEKRSEYFPEVFQDNVFLFTTARTRMSEIEPALITQLLNDLNCLDSGARGFPVYLRQKTPGMFSQHHSDAKKNLTGTGLAYLSSLNITEWDLFYHCLAVLHSRGYRTENKRALHHDWPRIPLPTSKEVLLHSGELGRKVAALLDTERGIAGVTEGRIQEPLDTIGVVSRVGGGQLQTEEDEPKGKISELRITAGWGTWRQRWNHDAWQRQSHRA
jgi:hypothetical protein